MKIHHLQRLFEKLPLDFMEDLKGIDFKTCWYGSAGMDNRPMELLDYSHPDALTTEKVDVFFYTDINYFSLNKNLFYNRVLVNFPNERLKDLNFFTSTKKGQIIFNGYIFSDVINKNYLEVFNGLCMQTIVYWKFNLDIFDLNFFDKIENNIEKEIQKSSPKFLSDCQFSYENNPILSNDKILEALNIKYDKVEYLNECVDKKKDDLRKFLIDQYNQQKMDLFLSNYPKTFTITKHNRFNGEPFYTFYIDIDDWTFERLLIKENIKINYTVHLAQQVSGPGPRCLGNLQTEYCICTSLPVEETIDFVLIPFTKEFIKEFVYDVNNPHPINFYKINS